MRTTLCFSTLLFLLSPLLNASEAQAANVQRHASGFSPALQQTLSQVQRWSLVIQDLNSGQSWGYHPEDWAVGSIPASTYKIPHSLIGLDSGVITPASVFAWNGQTYELAGWNRDHTLQSAYQASCVPCYQQLARKIGLQHMQAYLQQLNFGQMQPSAETLDSFWLSGPSSISPLQQVDFMARLARRQLPVKASTYAQLESIMADADVPGLYGKTGWGREPHLGFGDSQPRQRHYGWYVGYARLQDKTYAFAARLTAVSPVPEDFVPARRQLVLEGLQQLHGQALTASR